MDSGGNIGDLGSDIGDLGSDNWDSGSDIWDYWSQTKHSGKDIGDSGPYHHHHHQICMEKLKIFLGRYMKVIRFKIFKIQ